MWHCHYCRLPLSVEMQRKHQLCPNCGSDIHSCKNCTNFDESMSSRCRESNSPWVPDRDTTNDCPYFEFRASRHTAPLPCPQDKAATEAEQAKQAFRALFK